MYKVPQEVSLIDRAVSSSTFQCEIIQPSLYRICHLLEFLLLLPKIEESDKVQES